MASLEELLRKRQELLEEIDRQIASGYAKPVTLMFTDIVGSTEYFESAGDIAGRQMIQTHNDLLFPIIAEHGGRVIKTIGDSIMASFPDPARGVECAIHMQESLRQFNLPRGERERIRVRMGLHFGEAVMEEKDLFGDMVNTSARVEAKADGGEILISGSLQQQVQAASFSLVFLGSETVKGKRRKIDFFLVNWDARDEGEIQESWHRRHGREAVTRPERPPASRSVLRVHGPLTTNEAATAVAPLVHRGNPYLNRVMIPHPDGFFGRRWAVKRIVSRISTDRPQSVSIVGERRIGKSSLLNYLNCPRTRVELLPNAGEVLFLFLDFQQLRTLDESRMVASIFSEAVKQLGENLEGSADPDLEGLRRLCEAAAAAGLRLVLLFDEFESVTKNERIGPEFYSYLRSLANNYPLAFVTASGRQLKDMCVTHEIADSPFFNIFTSLHLGVFTEEEADELIRTPSAACGIPLEPLTAHIRAMGGRYPFFLQMACSAWFEYLEAEGLQVEKLAAGSEPPKQVLEVFREEAEPHFEYVLETLPKAEQAALAAVLRGGSPEAEPAESLERKGYLVREADEGYQPFSTEFRRFGERSASLGG
jgi:class 3 adenylate cyclase